MTLMPQDLPPGPTPPKSPTALNPDLLGHGVLERRIRDLPQIVEAYLAQPFPKALHQCEHTEVTGVGSSKAHALYLVHLLNLMPGRTAQFRELSSFEAGLGEGIHQEDPTRGLVLFSQGLSPSAHSAARKLMKRSAAVLFSAASTENTLGAKQALLQQLASAQVPQIAFPLPNEYEILVRVIGPLLGYLAAYQFAAALPDSPFEPLPARAVVETLRRRVDDAPPPELIAALSAIPAPALHLVTFPPTSAYAHNLCEKLMEGAFLPRPTHSDIGEFDHGRFQNIAATGGRVILVGGGGAGEVDCAHALEKELQTIGIQKPLEIISNLPPPLQIVEFEMALNVLMLSLARARAVNQRDWPGKGKEVLYGAP